MKKIITILLMVILITGCVKKQSDDKERLYLSNKYYNKGDYISVKAEDLDNLKNDTYVLFTYNNYCSLPVPCDKVFEEFMDKYNIDFLSIPFSEFQKTTLYETVKFAPSIIIVQEGTIIDYLKADKDEDLDRYQDAKVFEEWLDNYIYFSK